MTFTETFGPTFGDDSQGEVPADEASVGNVIELVRQLVYATHRAEWNRLSDDITAAQATLAVDFDIRGIARGTYISIDDEVLYVWEVAAGTGTATVQRGMLGSTAAVHSASAMIEVNPRFPQHLIRQAIRDELRSWGKKLFSIASVTLTPTSRAVDIDGVTEFFHVLECNASPRSGDDIWYRVPFRVVSNMDTADFASGRALLLETELETGQTLRVTVARPFELGDLTDDINLQTQVGLAASMLDIVPLGAGWRLMAGREIMRTQVEAQGQPRNAAEVPPGHNLQTAKGLKELRDDRINEEAMRLALQYNWKRIN